MTDATAVDDPPRLDLAAHHAPASRPRTPAVPRTGTLRTAAPHAVHAREFRFSSARTDLVALGDHARLHVRTWDGPSVVDAARRLLDDVAAGGGPTPVLVGVIPFDTSRPAELVVPEHWSHVSVGGPGALPVHRPAGPAAPSGAHPVADDAPFRAAVRRVVEQIREGAADKVVLARTLDVRTHGALDRAALRDALSSGDRDAYVFDVCLPDGEGHLVGASPELLVSVTDGYLRSTPLAGSAARSQDPGADRAAGERLLTSAKDLAEHAVVVDAIRSTLAAFVDDPADLHVPRAPSLVATARLWHLGTDMRARLRPGVSALEVAYALHPTPAVCGYPTAAARDLIAALEPFDRGFYTGLVGWSDARGDGEWAIALRCGIVRGDVVRLFAGAGVVAGSTAEGEHAETAVKFGTLLDAIAVAS